MAETLNMANKETSENYLSHTIVQAERVILQ